MSYVCYVTQSGVRNLGAYRLSYSADLFGNLRVAHGVLMWSAQQNPSVKGRIQVMQSRRVQANEAMQFWLDLVHFE